MVELRLMERSVILLFGAISILMFGFHLGLAAQNVLYFGFGLLALSGFGRVSFMRPAATAWGLLLYGGISFLPAVPGVPEAWSAYFRWTAFPLAFLTYDFLSRPSVKRESVSWFCFFWISGLTLLKFRFELVFNRALFVAEAQTSFESLSYWLVHGRAWQPFFPAETLSAAQAVILLPLSRLWPDFRVSLALCHFVSALAVLFLFRCRGQSWSSARFFSAVFLTFPTLVLAVCHGSLGAPVALLGLLAAFLFLFRQEFLGGAIWGILATAHPLAAGGALIYLASKRSSRAISGALVGVGFVLAVFGAHFGAFSESGFFSSVLAVSGVFMVRWFKVSPGRVWMTLTLLTLSLRPTNDLSVYFALGLTLEFLDGDSIERPVLELFYALTRIMIFSGTFSYFSDIPYFYRLAKQASLENLPYRETGFGYPVFGWLAVWIPEAVNGFFGWRTEIAYTFLFRAQMLVVDYWIFKTLREQSRGIGLGHCAWLYLLLSTLLAPVLLDRLDLVLGAILLVLVLRRSHSKYRLRDWILLIFGILFKWAPILLLPFEGLKRGRRGWLIIVGLGLAVASVLLFPETKSNFLEPIEAHLRRGVQVEATWASIALLFTKFFPFGAYPVEIRYTYGSHEIALGMAPLLKVLSVVLSLGLMAFIYFRWHRQKENQKFDPGWSGVVTLQVFVVLGVGWVGSPQLLLWAIPLVAIYSLKLPRADQMRFLGFFSLACFLASVGLERYFEVSSLYLGATLLVFTKNLALVASGIFLARGMIHLRQL